jgi:hypothetical protein
VEEQRRLFVGGGRSMDSTAPFDGVKGDGICRELPEGPDTFGNLKPISGTSAS